MGIVRERELRQIKRELDGFLKPGETVTEAISRINEKISMAEIEVEDLEDQLRDAEDELSKLNDVHDGLIKLRGVVGEDPIPAKRKKRPEKKNLGAFV